MAIVDGAQQVADSFGQLGYFDNHRSTCFLHQRIGIKLDFMQQMNLSGSSAPCHRLVIDPIYPLFT